MRLTAWGKKGSVRECGVWRVVAGAGEGLEDSDGVGDAEDDADDIVADDGIAGDWCEADGGRESGPDSPAIDRVNVSPAPSQSEAVNIGVLIWTNSLS